MKIARINANGMNQIADALGQHHNAGRDHFTKSMLNAWAEQAENSFNNGNGCGFEIASFDSNSGAPVEVTITADGYDVEELIVNAAHTPGPWVFEYRSGDHPWNKKHMDGWGSVGLWTVDGPQILGTGRGWEPEFNQPNDADAMLITAAPELLEASKAALTLLTILMPPEDSDCERDAELDLCDTAINLLRAAIAKATGGAL